MGPAAFSQDDARIMDRMIADDGQDDFRENWSPKKKNAATSDRSSWSLG